MSSEALMVLGPIWAVLGATVVVCGVSARHSERALAWGCVAVSVLWVVAGAAVNAGVLVLDYSYTGFADGSPVAFVRETWESLVVPNQGIFIGLLVAFEALAGALVLLPGRPRQAALAALVGFNVALLSFGPGFLIWSVPVGTGLVLLFRAERRRTHGWPVPQDFPPTGDLRPCAQGSGGETLGGDPDRGTSPTSRTRKVVR